VRTAGFKYEVSVNLILTLDEAKLLKRVAMNHYDAGVRDSAERGVINGLLNLATWASECKAEVQPGDFTHPVTWGDLDTMRKALEQAGGFAPRTSSGPLEPDPNQYGYSGMALEMDIAFLGIMRQIQNKTSALYESPAPAP
jgi:hypothetical protein